MKRWQKRLTRRLILLFFAFSFLLLFFSSAGTFLAYDEPPQKSDVIIVLSGGQGRLEKGIELYRQGYASYLLLSNAIDGMEQAPDHTLLHEIAAYSLPSQAVLLETRAESTYDNALYTLPILQQHHFRSAIVVSSNYHMRRVQFNFRRVYRRTSIRLTFCASPDPGYQPGRWWSSRRSILITIDEYVKLAGNAIGIHGLGAKHWLNQWQKMLY